MSISGTADSINFLSHGIKLSKPSFICDYTVNNIVGIELISYVYVITSLVITLHSELKFYEYFVNI